MDACRGRSKAHCSFELRLFREMHSAGKSSCRTVARRWIVPEKVVGPLDRNVIEVVRQ